MQNPTWRPIPGFPAYEVTSTGRVRSALTQYVLTPRKGVVSLQRDGRGCRCQVADLVAAAWPAEQTSGVDWGSEPDRTAVCFVTLSPVASAELLDLAAEYDCLSIECAGLAWENEELQSDLTEAHKVISGLRDGMVRLDRDNEQLRERVAELTRLYQEGGVHEFKGKPYSRRKLEEENARLQRQVDEQDAELQVYRVSASI